MATTKPTNFTVNLADLLNILEQIKIAERHVATGFLTNLDSTPISPLLPAGLRTVDGSFNNLLPGQSLVGSADQVMPRLLTPVFLNDADGDTMALGPPGSGAPTGSVADADPRIISNLISDQTVGNFAAVFKALELAGSINPTADTQAILDAFAAAKAALAVVVALQAGGALPGNPALVAAQTAAALAATTAANLPVSMGLDISPNGSITILNQSPDIGQSPPFNGWMTLFGQFFDHDLDLIPKGGNGTVYFPLQPDDPLYEVGGPNFMALTRSATVSLSGVDGRPANTGQLIGGASGGIAIRGKIKLQAREKLGIECCRAAAPNHRSGHHADPGRRERRLGS